MGRISFKFENLIVLFIVVIMIMVLSFSFGVEKGKKILAWKSSSRPTVTVPAVAEPVEALASPENLPAKSVEVLSQPVEATKENVPLATPESVAVQPATVAPSEKTVDNLYTVQVASFKKGSTYAEKEAMNLKDKGYEILVIPKGKYSIVCVGKFALEDQANDFSKKLKKQYKDCLVRRL